MSVLVSLFLAVVPAVFLVRYYYRQDKGKPEPKKLILKIFFLGFVIVIPVSLLEFLISSYVEAYFAGTPLLFAFLHAFVVAALIEEFGKLWVVKRYAYKDVHFDEIMDGIVYMVIASLGFACHENIFYVLDAGWGVALIRAFTAVPLHAFASGWMGYYLGRAKFASSEQEKKDLIKKGYLIAVMIHGTYDFLLFAAPQFEFISAFGIFPLLIWAFFSLRKKIKSAIKDDKSSGRLSDDLIPEEVVKD